MCQRPCTGGWKQFSGKLAQVDVDDHEVWGVNRKGGIYAQPIDGSGDWRLIPGPFHGRMTYVSASGCGYVWGVNNDQQIFKCKKPCTGQWVMVDGLMHVFDGGQNEVCGVNEKSDFIFCRPVDGSGAWRQISKSMWKVTTSGRYYIFGISHAGEVFRCKKPCNGNWVRVNVPKLIQLDATVDGVDFDGKFYIKERLSAVRARG